MSRKRIAAFVVFYIGIVLAILFMHFYIKDRYGHNPDRERSDAGTSVGAYRTGAGPLSTYNDIRWSLNKPS